MATLRSCQFINRLILLAGVLFATHTFAASSSDSLSVYEGTLDDQLALISAKLSGFGGVYFDDKGKFVLQLQKGAARASLGAMKQELQALNIPEAATVLRDIVRFAANDDLSIREADYDFATLHKWRQAISKTALADHNVRYIDTDERLNRIVIAVENEKLAESLLSSIYAMRIPLEAVVIKEELPIAQALRTTRRPLGNALEIRSDAGFTCTMGIQVRYWYASHWVNGFLTNAHCTANRHVVTGTNFFQIWDYVGTELVKARTDPSASYPGCGVSVNCYHVDGVFVPYPAGVQSQGQIFRTAYWNPACTTSSADCPVDGSNPRFELLGASRFQFSGQIVHKVGRSTGWTDGVVEASCVDVPIEIGNPGYAINLCQNRIVKRPGAPATPIAMPGDSGSPVFQIDYDPAPVIAGMLWGTQGPDVWWHSPWGNIQGARGFVNIYHHPWGGGVIRVN